MRACFTCLVTAALVAGFAGCKSPAPSGRLASRPVPILDSSAAAAAGFSPDQVNGAMKLYTAKCVRCHKSYEPTAYNDAEWSTWMRKMSKKAKLTPDQDDLLSRYLEAVRRAGK